MSRSFRFSIPHVSSATLRAGGVYLAGALYSAAFYSMVDLALFSKHTHDPDYYHLPLTQMNVKFVDWIPFILSSLGMLVINTVEKSRLTSEAFSFGTSGSAAGPGEWRAKLVLFLGFALLAGGLAGSIVVLVLKYIVTRHGMPTLLMGIMNVVSNVCVMASCTSLWLAQNLEDEYSYSLQL